MLSQRGKLRHRAVKFVVQGHTDSTWQDQTSNGGGVGGVETDGPRGCITQPYSLCVCKDTLDLLCFPRKYTRTWV